MYFCFNKTKIYANLNKAGKSYLLANSKKKKEKAAYFIISFTYETMQLKNNKKREYEIKIILKQQQKSLSKKKTL